jgi:hypothetical protein
MRGSRDSTGELAIAMIAGTVLVGPVLGWWPLVGILAACGSFVYVASQFNKRR